MTDVFARPCKADETPGLGERNADRDMNEVVRPESLTEQVYRIIKRSITSGQVGANQRLVERTIASELKVSKTPVREALARLEKEGLVVNVQGKGVLIRRLSRQEVRDILEVREVLEKLAAEKAAQAIDDGRIDALNSILTASEQAAKAGDLERYKEWDAEFHRIVREAGGNRKVTEIIASLEDLIRLVMVTSVALPGRPQSSLKEHRQILQALEARDPVKAGEYAREHVRNIRQAIEQHWESVEPEGEDE